MWPFFLISHSNSTHFILCAWLAFTIHICFRVFFLLFDKKTILTSHPTPWRKNTWFQRGLYYQDQQPKKRKGRDVCKETTKPQHLQKLYCLTGRFHSVYSGLISFSNVSVARTHLRWPLSSYFSREHVFCLVQPPENRRTHAQDCFYAMSGSKVYI